MIVAKEMTAPISDAIHLLRRPDGDLYSRMIPAEKKFVGIGKNLPGRAFRIVKKKVTGK